MILTNGEIAQIEQTINECVRAAVQPMSIILVVLNKENYNKLRALECSKQSPLYSSELEAFADNIHMVEFHDFVEDQRLLAHKTLALVPTQVVNYFRGQGIDPVSVGDEIAKQITQKLANHDLFDEREDQYFNERRERFIQTLVNTGLKDE